MTPQPTQFLRMVYGPDLQEITLLPRDGQRDLFPDVAEVQKLLGTLERERKKKPSPARAKRLAALRRKLQNVVDLIDSGEGGEQ